MKRIVLAVAFLLAFVSNHAAAQQVGAGCTPIGRGASNAFFSDCAVATGSANAVVITPTFSQVPTTPQLVKFTSYRFQAIATNTGAATIRLGAAGPGPYQAYTDSRDGPVAVAGGEIVFGNWYTAEFDPALNSGAGGWRLTNHMSLPQRTIATTTVGIYVDKALGTDSLTCGLTPGAGSCETIQAGINRLRYDFDMRGNSCVVNVAAGVYPESVQWVGGQPLGVSICALVGDRTTPRNVKIVVPTLSVGIFAKDISEIQVFGFWFEAAPGASKSVAITAGQFGIVDYEDVDFGDMGSLGGHVFSNQLGSINATGPYTISGSARFHLAVVNNASWSNNLTVAVTFVGAVNFSTAFALIAESGYAAFALESTFIGDVGLVTGKRFEVSLNGMIDTGTNDLNRLPGNTPGTWASGGFYDAFFQVDQPYLTQSARSLSDLAGVAIGATVASSNLTISLLNFNGATPTSIAPVTVMFRNANGGTGNTALVTRSSATTFTINSGNTMGCSNNIACRIWVVMFNNGVLGAFNCTNGRSITPLPEYQQRTAAGGNGGSSAATMYASSAVASPLPFRTLGYIGWEAGLPTAGAYSAVPDVIQLAGGNVPYCGQPVGGQQVTNINTPTVSASATYVASTLGATYTPTSAANLVRVEATGIVEVLNGTNAALQLRSGTTTKVGTTKFFQFTGLNYDTEVQLTGFDKPNCSSANCASYFVYISSQDNMTNISFPQNTDGTPHSQIIIQEFQG